MWYNNILEVIGNTPIVRLNKFNSNKRIVLLAKLEFMNPGGSVKDRIGIAMVEKAVREGKLKKGGTIVEPTSGNTGVGLAIVAAIKGYKTIFVMPDKMSEEKRNLLRAYGAKVVITPTAVSADDPRSYYKVSDRLTKETDGAFKPDQYSNLANPQAHYQTTGPEIWEQTKGKVTHVVVGVGTGGTITGIGKFLKKKNPSIKIIAADPEGSVYAHYFKTRQIPNVFKTYKVEGVGEDFLPETIDFSVVDEVITVNDEQSFHTARKLATAEGILAGGSSGLAVFAAQKVAKRLKSGVIVVILPDSGKNYLSKFYNDDWMSDFGFIHEDENSLSPLLEKNLHFITIESSASPQEAIKLMQKYHISQIPVVEKKKIVGTITETTLTKYLFGQEKIPVRIAEIMDRDFVTIAKTASINQLARVLKNKELVIITDKKGKPVDVLTRIDLLSHLAKSY